MTLYKAYYVGVNENLKSTVTDANIMKTQNVAACAESDYILKSSMHRKCVLDAKDT